MSPFSARKSHGRFDISQQLTTRAPVPLCVIAAHGEVRNSDDEPCQHTLMGTPPQELDEIQQYSHAVGRSWLWHRRGGPRLEGVLRGHGGGTQGPS